MRQSTKMTKHKIEYVDWGLANWYEDKIEVNRNLRNFPELHRYVLRHERSHKKGNDLLHDIKPSKHLLGLFVFCLRYPKTMVDLSPLWIRDNRIVYDKNKALLYSIAVISLFILSKIITGA